MWSPTVIIGAANVVERAQLKPMPSSQETSTMRLPGLKAARSSVRRYVSGLFGSCSVQLTTMSLSARNGASGTLPRSVMTWLRKGASSSWSNCTMFTEWMGAPTAATPRLVSTWTSWMPCAFSAVTAPRRGAEANHDGAQPAPVVPGGTCQRQRVQDRAVAGQLIVFVEHVQAEPAVAGPVVHGLKRDEGQFLVNCQLGDGAVLDAVRPPPEDLPVPHLRQVFRLR